MPYTLVIEDPIATSVKVNQNELVLTLEDGRTLTIPLSWYPRLFHGTKKERSNFNLIGNGRGIHWPELDEDISIEGLIAGRPSSEKKDSLEKWLKTRITNKT